MAYMTEEELEIMSFNWFKKIGYSCVHDPDLLQKVNDQNVKISVK